MIAFLSLHGNGVCCVTDLIVDLMVMVMAGLFFGYIYMYWGFVNWQLCNLVFSLFCLSLVNAISFVFVVGCLGGTNDTDKFYWLEYLVLGCSVTKHGMYYFSSLLSIPSLQKKQHRNWTLGTHIIGSQSKGSS